MLVWTRDIGKHILIIIFINETLPESRAFRFYLVWKRIDLGSVFLGIFICGIESINGIIILFDV
mgnify:CR=1 FL=1